MTFTALINVSLLAETLCAVLSLHSLQSPLEMSVMELAQRMSWLWLVGSRGSYKWWNKGSGISNTSVFDFMKASSFLEKWGCELLFYCSMGLCEVRGRPKVFKDRATCWLQQTMLIKHDEGYLIRLSLTAFHTQTQFLWRVFCTAKVLVQILYCWFYVPIHLPISDPPLKITVIYKLWLGSTE